MSRTTSTSGPPNSVIWIARMQRASLCAGTRSRFQRVDEGLVGAAGPLLEPDLAGAVRRQVCVETAPTELVRRIGRGGRGKLGMKKAAVARHPAAGRAGRD